MENSFCNILAGKQLLLEELPFDLLEDPYISKKPGIVFEKNRPSCCRCGNKDAERFAVMPCSRCGKPCVYCRACLMMGRVNGCSVLYGWSGEAPEITASRLEWSGVLSDGQQAASNRVVNAIRFNEQLLVWAVCGAGKTELLFRGIEAAFKEGKRVCIATPRTDVVLELTPRLQAVFSSIKVASLYGGSEDRHLFSPLTITTTHQLIRFHEAFDVMIVDEVDAFPYSIDPKLQFGVKNARKEISSLIYLTATPSRLWQQECKAGKREYVTIPARFHRCKLPVPKFVWCGNWGKVLDKGGLPTGVKRWLTERLSAGVPVLLFVPTIELTGRILPLLKVLDERIEAVHAEDRDRKQKVMKMRKKEIPMLVTTTILERGVTFPGLDVAVLGAEDRVFSEAALVQIAGRVGRSKEAPYGDVTFFHYGKTEAMLRAKKQIVAMNKEAQKKGLIDG